MQTVNISLPKSVAQKLDEIIKTEGYASKSEFIRSLMRFYLVSRAETQKKLDLLIFKKTNLEQVEKSFRKSGKYSDKFIKSVVKGFSKSSLYADN